MAFECLNYERKDATCYLTLNRPDKLNALNAQLLGELRDALEIIELDPEIRVVILTGAGRAFSAGFDLDRGSGGVPPQGDEPDVRRRHLKSHIDTFMMVWNLSRSSPLSTASPWRELANWFRSATSKSRPTGPCWVSRK